MNDEWWTWLNNPYLFRLFVINHLVKWHLSSCSKLCPYNDGHVKINNMLTWLLPELEICLTPVFTSAADIWVFSSDKQLQWRVPWVLYLDTPPTTPLPHHAVPVYPGHNLNITLTARMKKLAAKMLQTCEEMKSLKFKTYVFKQPNRNFFTART